MVFILKAIHALRIAEIEMRIYKKIRNLRFRDFSNITCFRFPQKMCRIIKKISI